MHYAMALLHAYRRPLEVQILGGVHNNKKVFIPPTTLRPNTRYPFMLRRHRQRKSSQPGLP